MHHSFHKNIKQYTIKNMIILSYEKQWKRKHFHNVPDMYTVEEIITLSPADFVSL